MKRFYLCPVIGDGSEENPYRPKAMLYGVGCSGAIASHESGSPAQLMTVAEVNAPDHSALQADPEITDVTADE